MYIGVKYIGEKAKKDDNVCNTGAVWAKGQVVNFSEDIARELTRHTSVWELAEINPDSPTYFAKKTKTSGYEPVSYPSFASMDVSQLVVAAKQNFGRNINPEGRDRTSILNEVLNYMRADSLNVEMDNIKETNREITFSATAEEYAAYMRGEVELKLMIVQATGKGNKTTTKKAAETVVKTEKTPEAPIVEAPAEASAEEGKEQEAPEAEGSEEQAGEDEGKLPTLNELVANFLAAGDKKSLLALARQEGVKVANTMTAEVLAAKILEKLG